MDNINNKMDSERLTLIPCDAFLENNEASLVESILPLLSEKVTAPLPPGWQDIDSEPKVLDWLNTLLSEGDVFAIQLTQVQQVIGLFFSCTDLTNADHPVMNIGYLIGDQYWGNGYASEALKMFINRCRLPSRYITLLAGVDKSNQGSINVLKKCGFVKSIHTMDQQDNLFYQLEVQPI